jgi:RNA polymerase sigma factor (sigma-70 family)
MVGDMLLNMTETDIDLLRQFTRDHSQDAFTQLVQRHLNLVYAAALRQVRSPHLAQEVAQSVFVDLARNATKVIRGGEASSPGGDSGAPTQKCMTPWLYAVTRRSAIDVVRKESRRQAREQIAVQMNNLNASPDVEWTHLAPLLDEAMCELDETDRTAVLLRFFEDQSLRDVGEALGLGEDAAQKRVSRALEQLRACLAKHGITAGATGLGVVIVANAVQAAPVGLVAAISAAVSGTSGAALFMTAIQKIAVTAAVAVSVGVAIYQAKEAARARAELRALHEQQAPLAGQIQQLQKERDTASNRLAGLKEDLAQANQNQLELLKLRGEVSRLKRLPPEQTSVADDNWRNANLRTNYTLAKKILRETMPQVRIVDSKHDHFAGEFSVGDSTQYDKAGNFLSRTTNAWQSIGLGVDANVLVLSAYESIQAHSIFPADLPAGRYDYIANLPQGAQGRLQEEIRNRLGLTATKVEVNTNVYALVFHDPDSAVYQETNMFAGVKVEYWSHLLEGLYHAPVVNLSGLTNYYVFDCNFHRPRKQTDDEFKQIVLARIRGQLGLELIATNYPIEMLVVEDVK